MKPGPKPSNRCACGREAFEKKQHCWICPRCLQIAADAKARKKKKSSYIFAEESAESYRWKNL